MPLAALVTAMLLQVLTPGVYSNKEQVYFEREAGGTPPPPVTLRIDGDRIELIDPFGATVDRFYGRVADSGGDSLSVILPDGRATALRRARPATCWAATLKDLRKADGSDDWHFERSLKLHDQGGVRRSKRRARSRRCSASAMSYGRAGRTGRAWFCISTRPTIPTAPSLTAGPIRARCGSASTCAGCRRVARSMAPKKPHHHGETRNDPNIAAWLRDRRARRPRERADA